MTPRIPSTQRLGGDVSPGDLARLAELHRKAITGGFLATLGDRFLRKLYATLCSSPHAAVYVERQDQRIVGFIVGSVATGKVYREFIRSAGATAALAILPKLVSWRVLKRVVETALYPARRQADDSPGAEVLNFCVASGQRGRGVGQRLFAALTEDFQERGLERLRIVTGSSQRSAQRFYESAGARPVGQTQVHKGEESLVYEYDLANPQAAAA